MWLGVTPHAHTTCLFHLQCCFWNLWPILCIQQESGVMQKLKTHLYNLSDGNQSIMSSWLSKICLPIRAPDTRDLLLQLTSLACEWGAPASISSANPLGKDSGSSDSISHSLTVLIVSPWLTCHDCPSRDVLTVGPSYTAGRFWKAEQCLDDSQSSSVTLLDSLPQPSYPPSLLRRCPAVVKG